MRHGYLIKIDVTRGEKETAEGGWKGIEMKKKVVKLVEHQQKKEYFKLLHFLNLPPTLSPPQLPTSCAFALHRLQNVKVCGATHCPAIISVWDLNCAPWRDSICWNFGNFHFFNFSVSHLPRNGSMTVNCFEKLLFFGNRHGHDLWDDFSKLHWFLSCVRRRWDRIDGLERDGKFLLRFK